MFIPGVPGSAEGASFGGAIAELVDAMREYAEDWQYHLFDAPNHPDSWKLIQLIALSYDQQLPNRVVGQR